jgi:ribonuclease-3
MCHRSWCAEHPGGTSNERLEFLGDAVLGAVVAEELYRTFPAADEGWLSRARATVVRATTLAEAAEELDLGAVVRLGKGEEATGGREKPSILSDALEALIGAVHLDGGRDASTAVVMTLLGERIREASGEPGHLDDKSRLQEHVSRVLRDVVSYRVSDTGPEHDKTFTAIARVGGRPWGTGTGRSKKQAEQLAARAAYDALLAAAPSADGPPPADNPPSDGADTNGSVAPAPPAPPADPVEIPSTPRDESDDA